MKQKTFLFFGSSGSGKGTQARLLQEYLNKNFKREVLYIETGAELRKLAKENTKSGHLTKNILENGKLMPSFVPIWVWSKFLLKNFSGEEYIITDGLSRRLVEAQILDSALDFYNLKNTYIVFLNVTRDRAIEMMKKRGRADDTEEYMNNRLDWFEENAMPAIMYFRNSTKRKFLDIDGNQSIEKVQQDILEGAELL